MSDGILPFDTKLGLPQKQRVKIDSVAYDLKYSWNPQGSFVTLEVTKVEDGAVVLNTKLAEYNPLEAKDPATHEVLFTVMPRSISQDSVEVWAFWG